jgi:hypothetical protein
MAGGFYSGVAICKTVLVCQEQIGKERWPQWDKKIFIESEKMECDDRTGE